MHQRTLVTNQDNLQVLRSMASECIDLIATDPPFGKNQTFEKAGKSFNDSWNASFVDVKDLELVLRHNKIGPVLRAASAVQSKQLYWFLTFMAVRLIECHRILKPTGSLYLHCDPTASHYLKALLDGIFGRDNFS